MEGCYGAKPMFCPSTFHDSLILADNSNFEKLLYYNFSERTKVDGFDKSANKNNIEKLFYDSSYYNQLCEQSYIWFEEFFDVYKGVEKLLGVYGSAIHNEFSDNKLVSKAKLKEKIFLGQMSYYKNFICKNI